MASTGTETSSPACHQLTRQEIMALDQAALADLLVKLSRSDPGLNDLLSTLPGQELSPRIIARPFSEPFMVGESPAMKTVFETVRRVARTDAPVLIMGESGTGKELAARSIHERSEFSAGPFIAINCGGLPATLIASELFGHERGAFTGAHQRKIGKLEAANGGTLMLDEIGDMPMELQPHLLRFLQEMTIERVGSNKQITLNLRVIAATNRNLRRQVQDGSFREDLFHRLDCLSFEMPPLRKRDGDIELLAGFFLKRFAAEMGQEDRRFSQSARTALRCHAWPGNVRELISRVRRAVVMTDAGTLTAGDLGLGSATPQFTTIEQDNVPDDSAETPMRAAPLPPCGSTLESAKALLEEKLVRDTLGRNNHNVSSAARDLGVSRVTLYRLMDKYQIRNRSHLEIN